MPALNIHDAPKGTEARRAEPGTLGCKECIYYSAPGRCTKSSPRRCGAFAREDRGDVCFVAATGNPRVSLRTHSGAPTPPEWATRYKIHDRSGYGTTVYLVSEMDNKYWPASIQAVEWLK